MNRIMYTVVAIGCVVVCNSKLYDSKEQRVRPISEETVNNENQRAINRHTIRFQQNPNLQTIDMHVSVVPDIKERGVDNEQYKQTNDKQSVFINNNVQDSTDKNGLNTEKLQDNTNATDAVSILAQKHKRSIDQDAVNTTQPPKLNSLIFKHFGPEKLPNEPSTNKPSTKTEHTIHEYPATIANNTNIAAGISTRVIEETTQKVPDTNGWQAKKTSGFVYIAYSIAFLFLFI